MCTNKSELRVQLKKRRKALYSSHTCAEIAKQFFQSPFFNAEDFFVYLSFGAEVDTKHIIARLREAGKTVCVPFIKNGQMQSVLYEGALEKTALGFFQPVEQNVHTCAVALVPLLGVDERGNRLGYGGGYYDKYFAEHPTVKKVGLAFFGQVVPSVPYEKTDIPLDAVLTEQGILIFT